VDTGHNFVNLVGGADGDSDDQGRLHVTFHHNWWSTLCRERMPSVRYGRAHVYNNYFNCPGNNYCVRTRLYAESRIENNWFENVKNPWEVFITSGTPGKVYADGNMEVNTTRFSSGSDILLPPGTDSVFAPPYTYILDSAALVPSIVANNAGAGKGPFAP
jgi:pectate lyase